MHQFIVCMCVCVRERERERESVCVCVCVWVCVRDFVNTIRPLVTQFVVQYIPARSTATLSRLTKTTSISTPEVFIDYYLRRMKETVTCPKCGTFKKSGSFSCCAPGGAWYKNCGGTGNRNVEHRWSEGREACKCKCHG